MGHQGRDWTARVEEMSGTRLVKCDRDPNWECRIVRRLSGHTGGRLVGRDAITAGYLASQVVSRRCK